MKNSSTHSNQETGRKSFGYHLILDLYECNQATIGDINTCYCFLDTIPDSMATHKQSRPFVVFTKGLGFAGWVPIVESGVSLYTNIPLSFASVDIYSCKKFDAEKIKELTLTTFEPKRIKEHYITRGDRYIHPVRLLNERRLT